MRFSRLVGAATAATLTVSGFGALVAGSAVAEDESHAAVTASVNNLNAEKTAAINSVNALLNLTKEQKENWITQINSADNKALIDTWVDGAKSQDTAFLDKAINDAVKAIEGLSNLSTEDKQGWIDVIKKTTDKSILATWVEGAKSQGISYLQHSIDKAVKEVQALLNLTEEAKKGWLNGIRNATDTSDVETWLTSAKSQDAGLLQQAKDKAAPDLKELKNLTEADKTAWEEKVKNANSVAEVNQTVINAKAADKAAFEKAVKEAGETLDSLKFLKDNEVNGFYNDLNKALTVEDVKYVVALAEGLNASEELAAAQKSAEDAVNALFNLSPDNKATYVSKINKAMKVDDVNDLVAQAKEADAKILADAQKAGEGEVNALVNLADADKSTFVSEIKKAVKTDDVTDLVAKAKEADVAALANAKKAGEDVVAGLKNLSASDKAGTILEINAATKVDNVTDLVDAARAADAKLLDDAKKSVSDKVETLWWLSNDVKDVYEAKIADADSVESVNALLADAVYADNNRLAEVKANDVAQIKADKNLTDDEKEGFLADLDKAVTPEEVAAVKAAFDKAWTEKFLAGQKALEEAYAAGVAAKSSDVYTNAKDDARKALDDLLASAKGFEATDGANYFSMTALATKLNDAVAALAENKHVVEPAKEPTKEPAKEPSKAPAGEPAKAEPAKAEPAKQEPAQAKDLPSTGVDATVIGLLAAALVALGGAGVAARRRLK